MAKNIGQLVISLVGDTKQFQTSMASSEMSIASIANKVSLGVMKFGAWTAAIGGATAGIVKSVKETIAYGEELDRLHKISGVSSEDLSKMGYAAEQEHASLEGLAQGMKFVSRNAVGNADAFKKIGIEVKDSNGQLKSSKDLLMDLSDYMANTSINQTKKQAVAIQLLGRSGTELVPFLSMGRAEIARLGDEAERLGIVMNDVRTAELERLGDLEGKLQATTKGLRMEIGVFMIPAMEYWTKKIQALDQWFIKINKDANLAQAKDNVSSYALAVQHLEERQRWLQSTIVDGLTGQEEYRKELDEITNVSLPKGRQELKDYEDGIRGVVDADEDWIKRNKEINDNLEMLGFRMEIKARARMTDDKKLTKSHDDYLSKLSEPIEVPKILPEYINYTEDALTRTEALTGQVADLFNVLRSGQKINVSDVLRALSSIIGMFNPGAGMGVGIGANLFSMFGMAEGGMIIPHAAQGMIVDKPQMIMAGEGGEAEIVSPISQFYDYLKSQQTNITIHTSDPFTYIEKMSPAVQDHFYRKAIRPAMSRDNNR